jgi:hypothetical protein
MTGESTDAIGMAALTVIPILLFRRLPWWPSRRFLQQAFQLWS